jgi:uncharacterized protein YdhG (YjbR/CyaY superfamily)
MRSDAKTVDEYIDELEGERKEIIIWLRKLLNNEVPGLRESMEYGMPTYKKGEKFFAFASQVQHVSLYISDTSLLERYGEKLGKVSLGKSCLRFRHRSDLDEETVSDLLRMSEGE